MLRIFKVNVQYGFAPIFSFLLDIAEAVVPSPNQSSIICGFDLCHLIKDYTLPFPLISLFYFNLPLSTSFFLNIYGCVLLFPNLQNKPEKPSRDFIFDLQVLICFSALSRSRPSEESGFQVLLLLLSFTCQSLCFCFSVSCCY